MNTFRVLAALLNYPGDATVASVDEMRTVLAQEDLLPARDRDALAPLWADLAQMDLYDLQARYVETFDQSRSLSLHLFEHVHGESLDRGQAMVDLLERYREQGLELSAGELPDFLPVFLEYLSQLSRDEALSDLREARDVIAMLEKRLRRRESPYAGALAALAYLAGPAAPSEDAAEVEAPQSVDAEWQEEPVDFSRKEKSFVGRQRASHREAK